MIEGKIPAEDRKLIREKVTATGKWLYGIWKKYRWMTDGNYVMLALPDDLRYAIRASKIQEEKFPFLWKKLVTGCTDQTIFHRVYPHTYEVRDSPVVWLADQDEMIYVAVQARYLDYLLQRYPTAVLLAKGPRWGVLIRVSGRGVKNIAAIIMPLEADYQPEDREDWNEVLRSYGVPIGEQGEGSLPEGE